MATHHPQAPYRLGFDIGGTFTDFILVGGADRRLHLHKCLTTPEDPSIGALAGLTDLLGAAGVELAEVEHVVHGTTLVTNSIIERSGARLGLLTTRGFRPGPTRARGADESRRRRARADRSRCSPS